MERVVQALWRKVVTGMKALWRKVVSGMTAFFRSVVSTWRKVVSGMTAFFRSEPVLSKAEEFAKPLVDLGLEALLFEALRNFLGGSGEIASVSIVILKIIIDLLRHWKMD